MYKITRLFHTADVKNEIGLLRDIGESVLRDVGVTCGALVSVDADIWPIRKTEAAKGLCQVARYLERSGIRLSSLEKVTMLFQGGYCTLKPYAEDPQFAEMQIALYEDDPQG